jgi:hypothetical protein
MFDSIRSHRRWLMFFLIVLVFPSFVITGIYSYNQFISADDAVARVGDTPISQQEFDVAQRQQLERLTPAKRRTCWPTAARLDPLDHVLGKAVNALFVFVGHCGVCCHQLIGSDAHAFTVSLCPFPLVGAATAARAWLRRWAASACCFS